MIKEWKIIVLCAYLIIGLFGGQYALYESENGYAAVPVIEEDHKDTESFLNNKKEDYSFLDMHAASSYRFLEVGALWPIVRAADYILSFQLNVRK